MRVARIAAACMLLLSASAQSDEMPEVRDWSAVRIKLERSAGFSTGPHYSVEISGDGEVRFEGFGGVVVLGARKTHIAKREVEELVQRFRAANFFRFDDSYVQGILDAPTVRLTFSMNGHTQSVLETLAAPALGRDTLHQLQDAVDRAADTDTWVCGTSCRSAR